MAQIVVVGKQTYRKRTFVEAGLGFAVIKLGIHRIVPPFVCIYRTGMRIARMEAASGSPNRAEPVVGLVLGFVFGLYSLYYQDRLNGVWDRYLRSGNVGPPALPPPMTPMPPPFTQPAATSSTSSAAATC